MSREPRHLKVTQEQYFAVALTLLAEQGVDGLTIASLCRHLGVTSGSFYHYFGSWSGFVDALLAHWEDDQTRRIVELAAAATVHPMERLAFMGAQAATVPHEAEAAIRAWGRSDDRIRVVVRRVDTRRHAELRNILADAQVDGARADELATMGMALLVGMQQLQRPVDVGTLRILFGELIRLVHLHSPASAQDS